MVAFSGSGLLGLDWGWTGTGHLPNTCITKGTEQQVHKNSLRSPYRQELQNPFTFLSPFTGNA